MKRYRLDGSVVTDTAVGPEITYTRQKDGSVICSCMDSAIEFHQNPVTGTEAEEMWNDLVRRCTDESHPFYWIEAVKPLPARKLKSMTDQDLAARFIKALYWLLNLLPRRCRKLGYWCEFVYPYGFVPEAGCPIHD